MWKVLEVLQGNQKVFVGLCGSWQVLLGLPVSKQALAHLGESS